VSQTSWAALLIVVGAIFEIGGVAAVVRDVRASKRSWRSYQRLASLEAQIRLRER